MLFTDILPQNVDNWEGTEKFLRSIVDILLAYIREENDRSSKVLDFHHPKEMEKKIDLTLPQKPYPLQKLLDVRISYFSII